METLFTVAVKPLKPPLMLLQNRLIFRWLEKMPEIVPVVTALELPFTKAVSPVVHSVQESTDRDGKLFVLTLKFAVKVTDPLVGKVAHPTRITVLLTASCVEVQVTEGDELSVQLPPTPIAHTIVYIVPAVTVCVVLRDEALVGIVESNTTDQGAASMKYEPDDTAEANMPSLPATAFRVSLAATLMAVE